VARTRQINLKKLALSLSKCSGKSWLRFSCDRGSKKPRVSKVWAVAGSGS